MTPPSDRALVDEGIRLHNAGSHMEAHDAFELAWCAATGARRRLLQGLIQLTSAGIHLERSRVRPAVMLLDRAVRNLRAAERGGGSGTVPVDLPKLVAAATRVRRRLVSAGARARGADPTWLPRIEAPATSVTPGEPPPA